MAREALIQLFMGRGRGGQRDQAWRSWLVPFVGSDHMTRQDKRGVTCASKKGFSQGEAPGAVASSDFACGPKFRFVGQKGHSRLTAKLEGIVRRQFLAAAFVGLRLMTWRPLTPRMHLVLAAHIRFAGNWSSGLLHLVRPQSPKVATVRSQRTSLPLRAENRRAFEFPSRANVRESGRCIYPVGYASCIIVIDHAGRGDVVTRFICCYPQMPTPCNFVKPGPEPPEVVRVKGDPQMHGIRPPCSPDLHSVIAICRRSLRAQGDIANGSLVRGDWSILAMTRASRHAALTPPRPDISTMIRPALCRCRFNRDWERPSSRLENRRLSRQSRAGRLHRLFRHLFGSMNKAHVTHRRTGISIRATWAIRSQNRIRDNRLILRSLDTNI